MSEERKKPLWPWIAALLIGLPVLYVASFGPACWMVSRLESDDAQHLLQVTYWPVGALALETKSAERLVRWYGELGMADGTSQVINGDSGRSEFRFITLIKDLQR